jgi:uncharacterized protein YqjF (DUF2071 family)
MGWRHLLFATCLVDPGLVDAHLPDVLSVDSFGGDAWLSVVPSINVAVRRVTAVTHTCVVTVYRCSTTVGRRSAGTRGTRTQAVFQSLKTA